MIKLKLNKEKLHVLFIFSNDTCVHIVNEKEKYLGRKRTIDFIQLHIQLEEMLMFKRELQILKIKKTDVSKDKLFSITLSPIQALLILTYSAHFTKNINDHFSVFVLNQQKDIIYRDLKTK